VTAEIVELDACAKVNLRLAVLARETTGYHSLETIFCGISLADRVSVRRARPGIELEVLGDVATGPVEENLCVRAANSFCDAAGIQPALRIELQKQIPSAAGLGGGSSDAAATLRALNELFDRPLSAEALLRIGARLGSDVPFFLTSTPLALAWSRGERLLEIPPLPARPVVVAHPGVSLPTPSAFARLAELRDGERPIAPFALASQSLSSWEALAPHAVNDFELVALERIRLIPNALRALIDAGAHIALLAGSGASIFGIFETDTAAERARDALVTLGLGTWRARTLEAWPLPIPRIDPNATNK
jgi:4-diphosphocytidyl-2-C-methyl-D-erythritol kinase